MKRLQWGVCGQFHGEGGAGCRGVREHTANPANHTANLKGGVNRLPGEEQLRWSLSNVLGLSRRRTQCFQRLGSGKGRGTVQEWKFRTPENGGLGVGWPHRKQNRWKASHLESPLLCALCPFPLPLRPPVSLTHMTTEGSESGGAVTPQ